MCLVKIVVSQQFNAMSYTIEVYHRKVADMATSDPDIIEKIDKLPKLEKGDVEEFAQRLQKYGYKPETNSSKSKEYIKLIGKVPVQVTVFDVCISFSVPYWEGSQEVIPDVMMDVSELTDTGQFCTYDQQLGEWNVG